MNKLVEKQTVTKVIILIAALLSAVLIGAALFRSGLIYDEWGNGTHPTPYLALKGLWQAGFLAAGLAFVTLVLLVVQWKKPWPILMHVTIAVCITAFSVSAFSVTTSWLNQIKADGEDRVKNAASSISIPLEVSKRAS